MGLSLSGNALRKPIYYQMYENKLVEHLEFSLGLGHNGGKFMVGGYNETFLTNPDQALQWSDLRSDKQYKINLVKYKVGNIVMPNSPSIGFIDSGTTFAYMSGAQKAAIDRAFTDLCSKGLYNCLGKRISENCYEFFEDSTTSAYDFFVSYPILIFVTQEHGEIKWFPSEYFYLNKRNIYCLAIDTATFSNEMIIGGSMLRQNMFVFDVQNRKIGYARAQGSNDDNMILDDDEIYLMNMANKEDPEGYK